MNNGTYFSYSQTKEAKKGIYEDFNRLEHAFSNDN